MHAGPWESNDVAGALRAFRERAGLTQQQLAERSHVSVRTIRNIEGGSITAPRATSLASLAEALELTPRERRRLGVRSPHRRPGSHGFVPAPVTRLIGRRTELRELIGFLEEQPTRLLTLTGVAGVGKTRLAQAAALALSRSQPVWWVPLGSLSESRRLLDAICEATGVLPDGIAGLAARLDAQGGVLVLDEVEHLGREAAELVVELLARTPRLAVMAVGRRPLGVHGEQEWLVRPLPIPPATACDPLHLESWASVQLLVERIRARSPGFALDESTANAVAEVCRRLDGLPLALELAAARWRRLGWRQLIAVLRTSALDLSAHVAGRPTAHRSLRDAIAASVALLDDRARRVLRCLSAFEGGTTVDTAVQRIGAVDALDSIDQLVASGLVLTQDDGTEQRLSVLRTVRAFVAERPGPPTRSG